MSDVEANVRCQNVLVYHHAVLSIWQVLSPGLTKTDLGLAILLTIIPKTIEKDMIRVRKLGILADGLAY